MAGRKDTGFRGFRMEAGEVARLVFDQGRVNLFSTGVLEDFTAAIGGLGRSGEARVLVITSEGPTFLAGADIREMRGFTPEDALGFSRLFNKAMDMVEDLPVPVVAGVGGFALGGGCELTLACDIVVASEKAVFGQPEVNIGLVPGAGGTRRLATRVGPLRARELIFTGARVNALEALAMGLVNRVVAPERLDREVNEVAGTIAGKPGHCIRAAKALLNKRGTPEEEARAFSGMFSHEESRILMDEFLKRR